MLIPSLTCPASCAYCFGPNEGGPPMCCELIEAVAQWLNALDDDNPREAQARGVIKAWMGD